jgi:N-acetylglucosamine-6-sulfatase
VVAAAAAVLAAAVTVAVVLASAAPRAPGASSAAAAQPQRPNIVVLMTDDQTVESMRVLPRVRRLIADQGVTFTNNFASYPLCCPSRATYLTGQYSHNHGVLYNRPPTGGFERFTRQKTTFPVALQRAGYRTIHIGKYLNGYGRGRQSDTLVPPGWSDWRGSVDPTTYRYFDYTLNQNGRLKKFGSSARDYQTDVYGRLAASLIGRYAKSSRPFFLNVAFLAPHSAAEETSGQEQSRAAGASGGARARAAGPALPQIQRRCGGQIKEPVPAPRYKGRFAREPLPRPPSFDEADVSDKPSFIQICPRFSAQRVAQITSAYRTRLETLLAVNDAVERIVGALRKSGTLGRTVVMATSDNGFFHGEQRIAHGKYMVYEPSVRVPLIIRGPGIARRVTRKAFVANVDLAPTILALARAKPLRVEDGRSLLPVLRDGRYRLNRDLLLETGANSVGAPVYQAVRTPRYLYVEYENGEKELYDLARDPYQLQNRQFDVGYLAIKAELQRRLEALRSCAGASCRTRPAGGTHLAGDG